MIDTLLIEKLIINFLKGNGLPVLMRRPYDFFVPPVSERVHEYYSRADHNRIQSEVRRFLDEHNNPQKIEFKKVAPLHTLVNNAGMVSPIEFGLKGLVQCLVMEAFKHEGYELKRLPLDDSHIIYNYAYLRKN